MSARPDPGAALRALHVPGDPFILANAWDAGSARLLVAMGAPAIGTSSAAHSFTLGRADMGGVTRDETLAHAETLIAAVRVPVSGDFENGFGAAPETVAETVRLAAEAGLAGISLEDTDLPGDAPYAFDLAVERIRAAAAAARALPRDFVLVARADGVANGQYGLDEGLRRLIAFEAAGADCLYIPRPGTLADQARICRALRAPVNALASGPFTALSRADLARAGVARISIGGALARATQRLIHDAAEAMFGRGDFTALGKTISGATLDDLLQRGAR
jgi:2-methylisocitrate lyase-like PEP mutase family enzyme